MSWLAWLLVVLVIAGQAWSLMTAPSWLHTWVDEVIDELHERLTSKEETNGRVG